MDLLEGLTRDHERLRRSMAAMAELLSVDEGSASGRLGRETVRRLREVEMQLTADLKAHEAREEGILEELGKDPEMDLAPFNRAIRSDRECFHDVLHILEALMSSAGGEQAYSVRFSLSSLAYALQRHLALEEKQALPMARRLAWR